MGNNTTHLREQKKRRHYDLKNGFQNITVEVYPLKNEKNRSLTEPEPGTQQGTRPRNLNSRSSTTKIELGHFSHPLGKMMTWYPGGEQRIYVRWWSFFKTLEVGASKPALGASSKFLELAKPAVTADTQGVYLQNGFGRACTRHFFIYERHTTGTQDTQVHPVRDPVTFQMVHVRISFRGSPLGEDIVHNILIAWLVLVRPSRFILLVSQLRLEYAPREDFIIKWPWKWRAVKKNLHVNARFSRCVSTSCVSVCAGICVSVCLRCYFWLACLACDLGRVRAAFMNSWRGFFLFNI